MKLKPRLTGVASLVPSGTVVADIGTDHAYLPVHLVKEKSCPRVIAVEKSSENCSMALETVNLFNLNHQVEVRSGDGLLVLQEADGVEVVVIAGLGGKTICRMLIAAGDRIRRYKRMVLQPMGDLPLVRRWLVAHGFYFPEEKLVKELVKEKEHFYEIIAVEKGRQEVVEPLFLELGPTLLQKKDPLLVPWLEHKLKHYEQVIGGLLRSRDASDESRRRYFLSRYERLKGVLEDVCRGK